MNGLYEMIGEIFGEVYSAEAVQARAEEDAKMLAYYRQQEQEKA